MLLGPKAKVSEESIDFSHLGPTDYRRIVKFTKQYLRVPKGEGAGEPFRLRKWQIEMLRGLFPVKGLRPRQGLISIPRGNGKSALAAVLGLYALFADEEPQPQVLVVASDERQARIVFDQAVAMIKTSEELNQQVQVYRDYILDPKTGGVFRPLPAKVDSLQGFDPSFTVVDELHVVDREIWDAMALAGGKRRRSLTLAISTPGDDKDSVMWDLVQYGRENPEDTSFYLKEFAAPEGCQIDDEDAWKVANPALGDFLFADAIRLQLKTTREAPFRRFRLGQWTGAMDRWLPWGLWEELENPDRAVESKTSICLGFDGSYSGDSTALVACTLDGFIFPIAIWQNPGDKRWRVPREEVARAVDSAFHNYSIIEMAADPWGWQSELEEWAKKHGEKRVIEWNTGAVGRMAPATDRFYTAVTTKEISHDGNEVMAQHVNNCQAKSTSQGDVIVKDKKGSPRKIDSAVAAIVAYDRAMYHRTYYKTKRRKVVAF